MLYESHNTRVIIILLYFLYSYQTLRLNLENIAVNIK